MAAKKIVLNDEVREKVKVGVSKLAGAVKVTLGPRGRNVVISRDWGSPTVTKDGVTVMKRSTSRIPTNMGAQMVKEVASKTGSIDDALQALVIYNAGLRAVAAGANPKTSRPASTPPPMPSWVP